MLCLKDTGIGIAPQDLPRIFEKGYTGCNGRTDKKASGLGLYLCKRICKNLGIGISITSEVDNGTCVYLSLDQCQAEDADIIVLAKSTGALEFTTGTYGQEICVNSIIKGNEWIDENETCWIWRSYGMEVMDGQIVYRNVLNLMQDGTYLVFLNSNQLNAYRTEKEFQTASEYFGYLPIAGVEVQPIKENQRNVLYKEWSEIPVFISSKKVAAAWNEIAEMLLNKFEPDV